MTDVTCFVQFVPSDCDSGFCTHGWQQLPCPYEYSKLDFVLFSTVACPYSCESSIGTKVGSCPSSGVL